MSNKKHWTTAEIYKATWLYELYYRDHVAKVLDRSTSAMDNAVTRFKLNRSKSNNTFFEDAHPPGPAWSDDELTELSELHKSMNMESLKQHFDRDFDSVIYGLSMIDFKVLCVQLSPLEIDLYRSPLRSMVISKLTGRDRLQVISKRHKLRTKGVPRNYIKDLDYV